MNRNDFGLWGANLSSTEFIQALAALGVIWGEGLSPDRTGVANDFASEIAAETILSLVDQNRSESDLRFGQKTQFQTRME